MASANRTYEASQTTGSVPNPHNNLPATDRNRSNRGGASTQYELAPSVYGIRLLRSHEGNEVHLHMRTHGQSGEAQAAHLFTLAPGIGDVICFPAPQKAPVNDLRSAYRQAAGRAFAAEFLAPVNEILSMQADGRDIVSIAEEFAVSTAVVERQIENAKRIEAVCT